jgi:hypothetical protein
VAQVSFWLTDYNERVPHVWIFRHGRQDALRHHDIAGDDKFVSLQNALKRLFKKALRRQRIQIGQAAVGKNSLL